MQAEASEEEFEIDPDLLRQYMLGGNAPTRKVADIQSSESAVDLHINDDQLKNTSSGYKLQHQIQQFEKSIDTAIANGQSELYLVHGIGDGVLKKKLHSYLKKQSLVRSYENAWHPRYGYGATKVLF